MARIFICWLAACFLAGTMAQVVDAQEPTPKQQPQPTIPPSNPTGKPNTGQVVNPGQAPTTGTPGLNTGPTERRPPAAEYGLAVIATLGILVIVCMPTRKR